jgi:hypothetical protein
MMRLRIRVARNCRSFALDRRIALGLAELFLDFLQRHLLPLEPLSILKEVVGGGDHREDGDDRSEQLQRNRVDERQQHRRIGCNDGSHPVALRPQQRRHDAADHAQLGQPLGKIRQRLFGEQTSEAGHRRNSRQLRLDRFGREHDAVLHDVAGESGDAQNQKRQAESSGDIEGQRLHQRRQRRAVGRDLTRFGNEPPERGLQARRHRRGKHHDRHRAAGGGEPGVHLHAFDDVAAANRFFEASGVGSSVRSFASLFSSAIRAALY